MTRVRGAAPLLRARSRLDAEVDGRRVLVVADDDRVMAFDAICPHRGAPLQDAPVLDGVIVCPWHRSIFSVADGSCLGGPAHAPLTAYRCFVDGDDLVVEVDW